MIAFRKIHKSFGSKPVLSDVSFDVHDGEVLFIIGASGVGKSVLIKHLVGLLSPDRGEIFLDGEEISKKDERAMYPVRKKCAMVFQHSTLEELAEFLGVEETIDPRVLDMGRASRG